MKLSVILPVYNCELYVEDCIKSILNQSFADFELIIINDGSNDLSLEKCSQFKTDSRVRIINQENQGVAISRNKGLELATAPYIMFVDSDDLLEQGMLDAMMQKILSTEIDLCVCGVKNFYDDGTEDLWTYNTGVYTRSDYVQVLLKYFTNPFIGGPYAKIYKSKVLSNGISFEDRESFAEDFVFNMKYLRYVNTISVLETPYYLRRADNITSLSKTKRLQIPLWERKKKVYEEWSTTLNELSDGVIFDGILIQKFAVKTLIDICNSDSEIDLIENFFLTVINYTNSIIEDKLIFSYKLIVLFYKFNKKLCFMSLRFLSRSRFLNSKLIKVLNR